MPPPYASYAALAAEQTEGVDYVIRAVRPPGASWASIAIHGGAIEAGSGEVARAVADQRRMAHYEFAGIMPSGNFETLHITSALFDEPQCLALVAAAGRVLSFHGYAGDTGIAHTLIGGLDAGLRDRVMAALVAAGFAVSVASSELTGTDPVNICNRGAVRAGVQMEMSRALRESFFPGGDLSRTMRDSGQRTATFLSYVNAIASVMSPTLVYDDHLSRVRITGVAPGLADRFARTVADGWAASDSGHSWLTIGSASAFQVAAGTGQHIHTAVNTSRWSLAGWARDADLIAEVATDALATGGGHFAAAVARASDDGATCYLARLEYTTSAGVILTLRKRVAGAETLLVQHTLPDATHIAGVPYAVRLQVIGSTLRARAWLASSVEPSAWQLETTDTDVTAAGRLGVRSILSSANANPLPVTVSWGNIRTRGETRIERSTTGIRWDTVRGGLGLDGTAGATIQRDDYEFPPGPAQYRLRVVEPSSGVTLWTDQDSITPILDGVWLKSVARPFLNRKVRAEGYGAITRPSRVGVFDVAGRSDPIAVSDVRSSPRFELRVWTDTPAQARDFGLLLASGDTLLVHVPPDVPRISTTPSGYVAVGDVREEVQPTHDMALRLWSLPCTQVAAPGPDIVGSTSTYQTLINTWVSYSDMMVAHATYASLLELIGDPQDVIVP